MRRQSFSSAAWRNDTAGAMKQIVRFISSSKYKDHVVGYLITAGATEELGVGVDTSPRAQERFRKWLWEKYGKDEIAIERLFGAKIEAIRIPSAKKLSAGDCGNFLDPEKSRLVIEYRRFHPQQVVDSAIALCKAVKEESGGRMITGFFYGYTRLLPESGHLALRRVLKSKDVDFIINPSGGGGKDGRARIGKYSFPHWTETDSIQKAGKLFHSEIDARTSPSRWISELRPDIDPKGIYNEARWFGPPTIHDSLQLLKAIDNMSSLLDMTIGMEPTRPRSRITITLPQNTLTYVGAEVSPFFYVAKGGDDVAAAVLFLASNEAANIHGARLVVDGGCTAQQMPYDNDL